MKRLLAGLLLMVGPFAAAAAQEPTAPAAAQEPAVESADETAIRQIVAAYVEAFNRHDAEALANQWVEDAVYINRMTGEEVVGRKAIAEQFQTVFKETPDLKLAVEIESIRLLSPNVAVEQGSARLVVAKDAVEEIEYTAVYVRQNKKWLLDRVTDQAPSTEVTHADHLKVLEWMVGKWVDEDADARIVTECHWAKNQNFLVRSFAVDIGGEVEMSGMQVIGWDPVAKIIRSWTFDSDGGFAEGTWKQHGTAWYVSNKGVLAGGVRGTMVNVIKPLDADSFTWQTIERTMNGEILPNLAEVKVVREETLAADARD